MAQRLALLVIGVVLLGLPDVPTAADSVGAIAPLSGAASSLGVEVKRGIELAKEDFKELNIILEDSESQPAVALRTAQKLVNSDKVIGMIGPVLNSNVVAVARYLAEMKVAQLSLAPHRLPAADRPQTFFRLASSDDKIARLAGEFTVVQLKAKQAEILYRDLALFAWLQGVLTERLEAAKVGVSKTPYQDAERLVASAAAAASAGRDVVLVIGTADDLAVARKATQAAGKQVTIVGVVMGGRLAAGRASEIGTEPRTFMAGFSDPTKIEPAKEFVARYEKRFNGPMPDLFAITTYSAVRIIRDAWHAAQRRPEILSRELAARTFATPLGAIKFRGNGDAQWPSEAVWRIEGSGKVAPLVQATGGDPCDCAYLSCCENEDGCTKPCKSSGAGKRPLSWR